MSAINAGSSGSQQLQVESLASDGKLQPPLIPRQYLIPFILVTVLFFLWGIPNNLNDVLIRHFMKSFEISRFQAGLVQSAFYMGYFVLAMPAALDRKSTRLNSSHIP